MPTLTPDEITFYRLLVDDQCDPPDLSDTVIQTLYDKAYAAETDAQDIEDLTVYYMLRVLWAQYRKKTDFTDTTGQRDARSQLFRNVQEMLEKYEKIVGVGMAGLSTGSIDLAIDAVEDDL
jgi:hypothetical protein